MCRCRSPLEFNFQNDQTIRGTAEPLSTAVASEPPSRSFGDRVVRPPRRPISAQIVTEHRPDAAQVGSRAALRQEPPYGGRVRAGQPRWTNIPFMSFIWRSHVRTSGSAQSTLGRKIEQSQRPDLVWYARRSRLARFLMITGTSSSEQPPHSRNIKLESRQHGGCTSVRDGGRLAIPPAIQHEKLHPIHLRVDQPILANPRRLVVTVF